MIINSTTKPEIERIRREKRKAKTNSKKKLSLREEKGEVHPA